MTEVGENTAQTRDALIARISPELPGAIDRAEASLAEGVDSREVLTGLALATYFQGYRENAKIMKSINHEANAAAAVVGKAKKFVSECEEILEKVKGVK